MMVRDGQTAARRQAKSDRDRAKRALSLLAEFAQTPRAQLAVTTLGQLEVVIAWTQSRGHLSSHTIWKLLTRALTAQQREHLRLEVLAALTQFVDTRSWTGPTLRAVQPVVWHDGQGRVHLNFEGVDDWRDGFWVAFAEILAKAGSHLRRCSAPIRQSVCGRVFVSDRRALYCSARCAQRLRSREHYAAHRLEISDRRHRSYAAKRRRENPHLKVQRRRKVQ
jgi:hypothetical protein